MRRWTDPEAPATTSSPAWSPAATSRRLRDDLERDAARGQRRRRRLRPVPRDELAPRGREKQAAGRERYALASQYFLGATVDLDETYAWGFEELARLEAEMRASPTRSPPGGDRRRGGRRARRRPGPHDPRQGGVPRLDAGARRPGDRRADGTHFDIPEPVRRIECCLAPTSDGGIYYTGPSEDFTRPGRMWWAVPEGVDAFSTWREVTTVYHEGVPGPSPPGRARRPSAAELLNRWQRLLCWCSGHGEGWALYAERLMDELGYLDDPGDQLGMLDAQAFRAARVIVDIGMHLELEIPRGQPVRLPPGRALDAGAGLGVPAGALPDARTRCCGSS